MARPPRAGVRRRIWFLICLLVVAFGGGLAAMVVNWKGCRSARELDCATAAKTVADGEAVVICQREYGRTRAPRTGAVLANVLRRSGQAAAAAGLANNLLNTEARADALQILGKIAVAQNRLDDAVGALQEARKLHREENRHGEVAKDNLALAEIHNRQDQFAEALQSLEECITDARRASDAITEGYCRLAAGRVLIFVGYFEAADQELERAKPLLTLPREQAWLWYEQGNLHQEAVRRTDRRPQEEQAVNAFQRALAYAEQTGATELALTVHLNLAYSLAELGRTDEADRHLAEAGVLDLDKAYENQRTQMAARIAYRRGNAGLAYSVNERVYESIGEDDDKIIVSMMQARIALASNDLASAERWARRGVETAEKIRNAQTVAELRPWVLSTRREPFEVLFTVLARADQKDEALEVFDQWQGRTLLDTMARPRSDLTSGLSSTASKVRGLGLWLPSASRAPLLAYDGRDVIETLRKQKIDLVALAVAEGDVWRLTASRGELRIDRLDSFERFRGRLDRFISAPTDPAPADELGALILPGDLVRETREPLYVVLDAPLAALPFAALRRNDRPVIAARPVLRTPRLPTTATCASRSGLDGAVVLADVAGDLPDARRESSKVASLFKATPFVGAAATSTALFAARSDSLLHVAVHAEVDGGGFLRLHDRAVTAPEISASKLGPALVVLSACSTARSSDPELAGSLSTAFLAGGSTRVVATLRPVSDAGAHEVTSRFYQADGVKDPVRVLAEVQKELAGTGNKDWPSFAVFGGDLCTPRS